MRLWNAFDEILQAQRGHLFPWVPVCLGIGIGAYFLCGREPGLPAYATATAMMVALGGFGARQHQRGGDGSAILALGGLLVLAGFLLMGLRAHAVAAPVLEFRYYGPVEGRVLMIDRAQSDAPRVTLDEVRLAGLAQQDWPDRVRLSLFDEGDVPDVGARVMTTAHLAPPQGPAEPGGFDFRRHAWFLRLGGVGYTRVPLLHAAPPEAPRIAKLREDLSAALRTHMKLPAGGVAAALVVGDRAHVPRAVTEDLRVANLAHLLAISGLHMGLFAGTVFGLLRRLLCLWPAMALRVPGKQVAAVLALVSAYCYLLLSGGNVATERAFVMVAVMLVAVCLNRRALSLRAVALAAIVVLLRRPESLLSPGFQMSFAATTALVVAFGALRDMRGWVRPLWRRGIPGRVASLVVSSVVAGAATAPFAAAHFNMISRYGLLANLLAVPAMGVAVLPGALLAAVLAPLGMASGGLWLMGVGIDWIISVAHRVAGLAGARSMVPAPPGTVISMLALGGLWGLLWQGRGRWAAGAILIWAIWIWGQVERPAVLIAQDGGLVGVLGEQGRSLSRASGKAFVAGIWLENDGDSATQQEAARRAIGDPQPDGGTAGQGGAAQVIWRMRTQDLSIVHLVGKRGASAYGEDCSGDDIVVASVELSLSGPCLIFTPKRLMETGSIAVLAAGELIEAHQRAGDRLWTR